MMTTIRVLASAGMLGAAAGGAHAEHDGLRIGLRLVFGSGGCQGSPCLPDPIVCRPVVCEPARYRVETVWETVPRTQVWYDACGRRHVRTVYERVCRTVWAPDDWCDGDDGWSARHGGHGWNDRGRDHGRGRRHGQPIARAAVIGVGSAGAGRSR